MTPLNPHTPGGEALAPETSEASAGDDPSSTRVVAGSAPDRRRELISSLVVFAAVILACAILYQLRAVPLVRRFIHDLISAIFLIVPTILISRRDEDFAVYGLVARPLGRGLVFFGVLSAVVFPLFSVGFLIYYRTVCAWVKAGRAVPPVYVRMCPTFAGSWAKMRPRVDGRFAWLALGQLLGVALPEEYFFRGYLQTKLDRVWSPRRRFLGGGLGWSLVVASFLFALGHVLVDFNPLRFAVFFPALVFGWLRSATGSIVASVLFHASSNLISDFLHRSFF